MDDDFFDAFFSKIAPVRLGVRLAAPAAPGGLGAALDGVATRFAEARVRPEPTAAAATAATGGVGGAGSSVGGGGEILLSAVLPSAFRSCLPYSHLNKMQSVCFDALWHRTSNLAVAAPTGSGKTALFELAIIKLVSGGDGGGGGGSGSSSSSSSSSRAPSPHGKIVYLAPMRSLASERASDWRAKFPMLTVSAIVGGDELGMAPVRAAVAGADIIITTPEKFDSMTRRWRDHRELLGQVELLCVDEVHLLGESRGAVLEAVVTRMRTVSASAEVRERGWPGARLRVIALSATLPNLADIGRWVGAARDTTLTANVAKGRSTCCASHTVPYAPAPSLRTSA